MKLKLAVIAAVMAALPVTALAQSAGTTPTPRIDKRQENQQRRIDEGVKSGQLTEKEAARLQKGQQRVQKMEDKAMADGKLTREERRRIERAQDSESDRIRRETHDRQTARR
jgi:polyhydroxyalkanoate synthesis regulator phasin